MMIRDLQELASICYQMKVGQCLDLDPTVIREISPKNPLTGESGVDRLKSNIIGSASEFDFRTNPINGVLTIERIEPDGKIRHVDYDRRDFYKEQPDGTFELKELKYPTKDEKEPA